ncbi:VOC family protein [Pseudoruegeria sp. HB172150]|uniref:VOC family protein n=1 Tax=Pseudoruegeria sp. HB172150 TaxID=2721164 RepID=UPI001556B77E|nr:VOC family protein [Pseudoruegeria sp. HB172150]
MITAISPFLAFRKGAREALEFYVSAFPDAIVLQAEIYGPGEEGPEGNLRLAVLQIGAARLRLIDGHDVPQFDFTAAMSVFVECDAAKDVDGAAEKLLEGGAAMMPVDEYPFAERFVWLADKFGVNWQLIHRPKLETAA